jgi:iron complex outermembrane receptor protein
MRVSIAVTIAGLTLANVVSATEASSDDSRSALEEITVTAERRAEPLQKVPAQVDVFTAEQIATRGIKETADFIAEVPNMTFDRADSYHNSWVVVRGIASVTNADFPIAVVVDGVPQVDQKQFNEQLFDIKDIEVLKGPQGTLYGRDALGGAILIESESSRVRRRRRSLPRAAT